MTPQELREQYQTDQIKRITSDVALPIQFYAEWLEERIADSAKRTKELSDANVELVGEVNELGLKLAQSEAAFSAVAEGDDCLVARKDRQIADLTKQNKEKELTIQNFRNLVDMKEKAIADLTAQRDRAWEALIRLKELWDKGDGSLTTHYSLHRKIETMFSEAQQGRTT